MILDKTMFQTQRQAAHAAAAVEKIERGTGLRCELASVESCRDSCRLHARLSTATGFVIAGEMVITLDAKGRASCGMLTSLSLASIDAVLTEGQ